MNPRFPIYIVSKGRADSRITARELDQISVPYLMVIEAQEYDLYAAHIAPERLLILPESYLRDYDTCDDLGDLKSKGPGPARNFAWEHSISQGAAWHWVLDDNIQGFYRLNRNETIKMHTGAGFRAMEDFVLRYQNVVMSGPNYYAFTPRRAVKPPFTPNTRVYSCNLIRNDLPFRWRARYNEDTDLSLRILKSGLCTVQFNAFVQVKVTTQTMPGGNSDAFYFREGTLPKSQMLVRLHPDVTKLVWRFNRWHHHVNYAAFKGNCMIFKPDVILPDRNNEYGMRIKPRAIETVSQ